MTQVDLGARTHANHRLVFGNAPPRMTDTPHPHMSAACFQSTHEGTSMAAATVSMMLDSGLTVDEKAKLDRMQDRLAMIFAENGHSVRLCQASWHSNCRMIGFVAGLIGPPIVSLPSSQFLTATDDQLPYILDPTQGPLLHPVAVYAVDGTIICDSRAPNVIHQYRKGEFLGVFTHRHSYMAGINSTGIGEDGRPKNIHEIRMSKPQEWPHEIKIDTKDA